MLVRPVPLGTVRVPSGDFLQLWRRRVTLAFPQPDDEKPHRPTAPASGGPAAAAAPAARADYPAASATSVVHCDRALPRAGRRESEPVRQWQLIFQLRLQLPSLMAT